MDLQSLLIAWKEEYNVGIDVIDRQHQSLVRQIRRFQEAMLDGRAVQLRDELMVRLLGYIEFHFRFEERLMAEAGYVDLDAHKAQHSALTNQVLNLQRRIKQHEEIASPEVMRFLRHWLTGHIMKSDQKFSQARRK
ncbi:MAG TPA: bacteriohemerythrin [Bryobacteraceae bacterium]